MTDLKPCPFCGESERIGIGAYGDYVECEGCQTLGPNRDPDGKRWNAAHRPEPGMTREEIATRLYVADSDLLPDVACNHAELLIEEFVRRGWRKA